MKSILKTVSRILSIICLFMFLLQSCAMDYSDSGPEPNPYYDLSPQDKIASLEKDIKSEKERLKSKKERYASLKNPGVYESNNKTYEEAVAESCLLDSIKETEKTIKVLGFRIKHIKQDIKKKMDKDKKKNKVTPEKPEC